MVFEDTEYRNTLFALIELNVFLKILFFFVEHRDNHTQFSLIIMKRIHAYIPNNTI